MSCEPPSCARSDRETVCLKGQGRRSHLGYSFINVRGALYSTVSSYSRMYTWKVPELTRRRRDAVLRNITSLYNAPFFASRHGYKLCLRVYLNGDGSGRGTHVSFFITLMKGEFDPLLPWPFKQTVSLSLLAQDGMS